MRPLLARISSSALAHNLAIARRHAGDAKILSVIKASAYGHGLARAALALAASDGYAVLSIDEAVQLRQMGIEKPILMLEGPFDAEDMKACFEFNLMPVLHSPHQLEWLTQPGEPLSLFLKFNSGMNRLGFPLADLEKIVEYVKAKPAVSQLTLMTHFATADEDFGIDWQWHRFLEKAQPAGLPICVANSAALLRYPETRRDWVRAGIMLYGASPFADLSAEQLGLKPAMTLLSQIIALQDLKPGEAVGYGLTYMADEATRVGIVACGYADGYPRHAPTGTPVLVNGRRTRTLGRVSMDMLAVDLKDVPEAGIGSPVVLWGEGLPVEDVARSAGTISYELLCALAPRVALKQD